MIASEGIAVGLQQGHGLVRLPYERAGDQEQAAAQRAERADSLLRDPRDCAELRDQCEKCVGGVMSRS